MKKLLLFSILIVSFIFTSCEDEAPGEYKESFIVDALLIVDEPIQGISVIRSQPIFDKYVHDSALVRNANVVIEGDGKTFNLKYRTKEDGIVGYYADDTTYKVKPNTAYSMKITLSNGEVITGETTTPGRTNWKIRAKEFIQYPKDTLKLPATDTVAWEKVPGNDFYLISVSCLDTLNYGKYLNPETEELNRRIYRPFGNNERRYREFTTISPIANTSSSIVWVTFKWFGLHQVKVFVPDFNFLRWYIQVQAKQEMDPLLTSVTGNAYGFFGSASFISDTSVVLKNQP